MSEDGAVTIVYDGDCPFCSWYVRLTRLKSAVGEVRLVDARDGGAEVQSVIKGDSV